MPDDIVALMAKVTLLEGAFTGAHLRRITSAVAYQAKKDGLQALVADLGSDRKFTNWRPKLNVGYEIVSDSTANIKPRPSGPWKVLDQGRWPGSKYSRKARRRVAWGPTRGKGTWERASREIALKTPNRVDREVQKLIMEALR